jgi:serine/threonine protein kinase
MTTTEEPATLDRGQNVLPDIQVIRHLHRSKESDIYDSWSLDRDAACVVKIVRPDRLEDADVVERSRSEGVLLDSLSHPNIVRAYEYHPEPAPAVVLERLYGTALNLMIYEEQRLVPWPEIITWMFELCTALQYVHRRGLLHLDVKPANIIVEHGHAKLYDFHLTRGPGVCRSGYGTRVYLSPEQARGEVVSTATDVWGLGISMYEVACGRRPFFDVEEQDGFPILNAHSTPLTSEWRNLPATLARAINSCLDPDPQARPTIADIARILQE